MLPGGLKAAMHGGVGVNTLSSSYSKKKNIGTSWRDAFIQNVLALYDLDAIDGDKNRNYAYFKELLLHRIMEIYPQYTDECNSQIQHEREKYSSKTKKRKET
jgi:hypothetical protein